MISLDHALVYDIETFPNCFTFNCQGLFSDLEMTFEISYTRDDRRQLLSWFCHWRDTETPLVGYNNIGCGLAGYTDAQIAPMFKDAPANCLLPDGWR